MWKGRLPELEGFVAKKIATMIGVEEWKVFAKIDNWPISLPQRGKSGWPGSNIQPLIDAIVPHSDRPRQGHCHLLGPGRRR